MARKAVLGVFYSSNFMTKYSALILASVLSLALQVSAAPKKLLVVSVTTGFRHSSIETGEKVLAALAEKSGAFTVDYVHQPEGMPKNPGGPPKKDARDTDESFAKKNDDYAKALAEFNVAKGPWDEKVKAHLAATMSLDKLKAYDGFVFVNTTGELPLPDKDGFINLIKSGKAFIGMHSATDTFHPFHPYIEMIGGEFDGHPWHEMVTVRNEDKTSPAGAPWPDKFEITDEIYQMKSYSRDDKHVILSLDPSNDERPKKKDKDGKEQSFFERGKREDKDYAVCWTKKVGQGRVFYTSLGHREEVWNNETYQAHILGGIKWALGLTDAK